MTKETNSWNIKMQDIVDPSEYATVAYSDAEDAKLKALIDANAAQIEEWANSISSGSYTWQANAVAVGDIASVPSTQGNWSVVTKIAIEPTPIGIGGVSVANMSIGDVISFTSPDDNDYATFEIADTDSANSTIDVTVIDSEGGPAYLSTVMVKHYPQIDTSNFVTNIEFNTAVDGLQDQIDNLPSPTHDHNDYSLTTHTHAYSPSGHDHSGEYAFVDHPHNDLELGISDLTDSVAELNKLKDYVFKASGSLPLTNASGQLVILGEDGFSIGAFNDAKSIVWDTTDNEVNTFLAAATVGQNVKIFQIEDRSSNMVAIIDSIAQSHDWSITPWQSNGNLVAGAEYGFELLPPYGDELQSQIDSNQDRIIAIETELEALALTREVGEWELVSLVDFDIRGSGQFTMSNTSLGSNTNSITVHGTDKNGINHGFDGVEVGDYVEVVQENQTRSAGDYGLWRVTQVNGSSFELSLEQSKGSFDVNQTFIIRFFYVNEAELDMAGMDARYIKNSGSNTLNPNGTWRLLSNHNGGGPYTVQKVEDNEHYLWKLPDPSIPDSSGKQKLCR